MCCKTAGTINRIREVTSRHGGEYAFYLAPAHPCGRSAHIAGFTVLPDGWSSSIHLSFFRRSAFRRVATEHGCGCLRYCGRRGVAITLHAVSRVQTSPQPVELVYLRTYINSRRRSAQLTKTTEVLICASRVQTVLADVALPSSPSANANLRLLGDSSCSHL